MEPGSGAQIDDLIGHIIKLMMLIEEKIKEKLEYFRGLDEASADKRYE